MQGVVEMDETFVGGERPGKRGRSVASKSLVVMAVELLEPQGIGNHVSTMHKVQTSKAY